jgi:putative FmdB family regulatory protein
MPTYEYECRSCGADFDVFQSMSDAPLETCPTCGQAVRRKINGGSGIIFKGSGFYKNDSRKSSAPRGNAEQGHSPSHGEVSGGDAAPSSPCQSCPASTSASSACDAPKKGAT